MIPFYEQPSVSVGPVTIHAFGVIVAFALLVGLDIGARRFARIGVDRGRGDQVAWWVIIGGFVGAHLFSVLLYFPRKVAENPLVLFRVWEDISSFGGILGGATGLWLFFRLRGRDIDLTTRLAYLDVAAFVFPVSLLIGRIGCALAHDHPGTVTSFPLGISLATGQAQAYITAVYTQVGRAADLPEAASLARLGFHDLGFYEMLYLCLLVVPAILILARRPRQPGFILSTFVLMYMPARFLLDFLRVSDVRYAGLTPAQWVALSALLTLAVIRVRAHARGRWIWPALAGAALACGPNV